MLRLNITGMNKLQAALNPKKYSAAAQAAFNKAQAESAPEAARLVSGRYNLGQGFLLSGGTTGKPVIAPASVGGGGLSGGIATRRGGVGLEQFGPTRQQAQQQGRKRKAGLQVNVLRNRATLLRQFFAPGRGTDGPTLGIYRRAGRKRLPIIRSAVSPASMIRSPTITQPLAAFFVKRVNDFFSNEIKK